MSRQESRPEVSPSDRAARGSVTAVLALVTFSGVVNSMSLPPFLPTMALDLGTTVPLLGQVPAIALLLGGLIGVVLGPLADQYGPRRTLLAGLLAFAVSAVGIGLAPSYAGLLAAALAGGFGRAIVSPASQALVGTLFAETKRRRAISWTQAGASLGAVVGLPALTLIAFYASWRSAFFALALLTAVAAGTSLIVLLAEPAGGRPRVRPGGVLAAYLPLLRHRPTLGLIGSALFGHAGLFVMLTYMSAFFVERHGFSSREVGLLFFCQGVGLLAGNAATAALLKRAPLRPPLVAMLTLRGFCFAGTLLLPLSAPQAVLLSALGAAFDGVYLVTLVTLLTNESPAGRATTMLLNGSAFSFGSAIGSSVGGLLLAVGGYGALGVSIPAFCCAGAALAWWSREPKLASGTKAWLP